MPSYQKFYSQPANDKYYPSSYPKLYTHLSSPDTESTLASLCTCPLSERPAFIIGIKPSSPKSTPIIVPCFGLDQHPTSLLHPSQHDGKIYTFCHTNSSSPTTTTITFQHEWLKQHECRIPSSSSPDAFPLVSTENVPTACYIPHRLLPPLLAAASTTTPLSLDMASSALVSLASQLQMSTHCTPLLTWLRAVRACPETLLLPQLPVVVDVDEAKKDDDCFVRRRSMIAARILRPTVPSPLVKVGRTLCDEDDDGGGGGGAAKVFKLNPAMNPVLGSVLKGSLKIVVKKRKKKKPSVVRAPMFRQESLYALGEDEDEESVIDDGDSQRCGGGGREGGGKGEGSSVTTTPGGAATAAGDKKVDGDATAIYRDVAVYLAKKGGAVVPPVPASGEDWLAVYSDVTAVAFRNEGGADASAAKSRVVAILEGATTVAAEPTAAAVGGVVGVVASEKSVSALEKARKEATTDERAIDVKVIAPENIDVTDDATAEVSTISATSLPRGVSVGSLAVSHKSEDILGKENNRLETANEVDAVKLDKAAEMLVDKDESAETAKLNAVVKVEEAKHVETDNIEAGTGSVKSMDALGAAAVVSQTNDNASVHHDTTKIITTTTTTSTIIVCEEGEVVTREEDDTNSINARRQKTESPDLDADKLFYSSTSLHSTVASSLEARQKRRQSLDDIEKAIEDGDWATVLSSSSQMTHDLSDRSSLVKSVLKEAADVLSVGKSEIDDSDSTSDSDSDSDSDSSHVSD